MSDIEYGYGLVKKLVLILIIQKNHKTLRSLIENYIEPHYFNNVRV